MPTVTYNTRFFFRFESQAGREFRIDIKKRGYSGQAVQRPLGQTPVLKMEDGDSGIHGTSFEIYAECRTDSEFAELYTSDAKEFQVVLSEISGGSSTVIWTGFVTPELYAEPEVAPPYDVQIVATDGLGELKLYDFSGGGRRSLFEHISGILAHTGLSCGAADIVLINSLRPTTPAVSAAGLLQNITVDLDYLAEQGTDCYEVLSAILSSLHMRLTRHLDKWLLYRDSDIEIDGGVITGVTVSGAAASLSVLQYGSMRTHRCYPVGRMETDIEPAKNSVTVAYPFRPRESMLENPNLPDGTGWSTRTEGSGDSVSWITLAGGERRPWLASSILGSAAVYQDLTVQKYDGPLTLRLLTMEYLSEAMTFGAKYRVTFRIRLSNSSATYYLRGKGDSYEWDTSPRDNSFECSKLIGFRRSTEIPISAFEETTIQIPGLPVAGTLRVEIASEQKISISVTSTFALGGVFLTQDFVPGYKDIISIDNDARGSASGIEVAFGDTPVATNASLNFRNILMALGSLTSAWETSNFAGEYLSVIAMDYALGVALPRLKTRGTLNVPNLSRPTIAVTNPSGIAMLVLSSSWRIKTDDMDVELISVPAAVMEITSEVVKEMTPEEAAGGSGASYTDGSSRSGGSPTGTQYFRPVENETTGETEGIVSDQDLYIIQTPEQEGQEEVLKNIADILRHLSLQVVDEGLETERTVLVSDITFASQHNIIAGGIGGGEDPGGGGSLATLADVALGTLAAGDILHYNATTSHWVNVQPTLALLTDVALGTPTDGQAIIWDAILGKWRPGTVASTGGIASVGLTMPEGFSVTGSPLTSDGTLAVTYSHGYSLPATVDVNKGVTAYGWGNHASAGYMLASDFTAANIVSTLNRTAVNRALSDAHGDTIASQTWVGQQGFLTSVAFGDLTSHPTTLSGYGITDAYISGGTITIGNNSLTPITSLAFGDLTSHPTTLAGYGITDAKISRGTITLGSNTITPLTSVSVSSAGAEIGTSLTVIGTVEGVEIKAKIASYLLSADFTAANIVSALGNTAVNRAIADGSGNSFGTSYLRKDTDDTMAAHLTVGTSGSRKTLTLYGSTSAALTIYGSSYYTDIYRNSSGLQLSSNIVVDGNITATGNIIAGSASDRRLKRDIKAMDINAASGVLEALRPVQFTWNEKARELGGFSGDSRGFLADEYNDIIPNATRKIWGEYDAIDYIQTIPYLVAGWQAQNLRIRILEGEIRGLKGDNEMMRRRLREHNVLL